MERTHKDSLQRKIKREVVSFENTKKTLRPRPFKVVKNNVVESTAYGATWDTPYSVFRQLRSHVKSVPWRNSGPLDSSLQKISKKETVKFKVTKKEPKEDVTTLTIVSANDASLCKQVQGPSKFHRSSNSVVDGCSSDAAAYEYVDGGVAEKVSSGYDSDNDEQRHLIRVIDLRKLQEPDTESLPVVQKCDLNSKDAGGSPREDETRETEEVITHGIQQPVSGEAAADLKEDSTRHAIEKLERPPSSACGGIQSQLIGKPPGENLGSECGGNIRTLHPCYIETGGGDEQLNRLDCGGDSKGEPDILKGKISDILNGSSECNGTQKGFWPRKNSKEKPTSSISLSRCLNTESAEIPSTGGILPKISCAKRQNIIKPNSSGTDSQKIGMKEDKTTYIKSKSAEFAVPFLPPSRKRPATNSAISPKNIMTAHAKAVIGTHNLEGSGQSTAGIVPKKRKNIQKLPDILQHNVDKANAVTRADQVQKNWPSTGPIENAKIGLDIPEISDVSAKVENANAGNNENVGENVNIIKSESEEYKKSNLEHPVFGAESSVVPRAETTPILTLGRVLVGTKKIKGKFYEIFGLLNPEITDPEDKLSRKIAIMMPGQE